MKQKLEKKLEQKLYKTVKKNILRKKLKERIQKGQVLPVKALIPLGTIIAAGFTVVPVTAAVVGYQIHKAVKRRSAPLPAPRVPELPPVETAQLPEDTDQKEDT